MPAGITLLQRHVTALAEVSAIKWISDNQVEIQVCVAALVALFYFFYAPYKFHAERVAAHAADALELKEIKAVKIAFRCEREGPASTMNHKHLVQHEYVDYTGNPHGRKGSYLEEMTLLGFTVKNTGTDTAKNCTAHLLRIQKDDQVLLDRTGPLWFEARDHGDDVPTVDLGNQNERAVCLCSVADAGEVNVGPDGQKWRHGPIHKLLGGHGTFVFTVQINREGAVAQTQQFEFIWAKKRQDCYIRLI